MAQRLKAIPTIYHGIEFRSKLEAKYAQAFDRLGIVWEYEGHGFRFDDGTSYCPDFYMPEIETYFEVKGVMDDASAKKLRLLANEVLPLHKRVAIGHPDGSLEVYQDWFGSIGDPSPEAQEMCEGWRDSRPDDGAAARCGCGKWFFLASSDSFECPACGAWDGDHHLNEWEDNVFEAAGWERGF